MPTSWKLSGPLGEGTFAVLHGLYWLTVNLCSERALLLVVDDLHWCDSASLRFLAYLARRLEDLPVVLVASLRSSEPETDQAILEELTSEPHAQVLMPGPLTVVAATEVVRDRLGEDVETAFAEACHSSTDGNPLLLNELLKALAADRVPPDAAHVHVVAELGPRAASRAVLSRLARLSEDAQRVARAISVLGEGAEISVAAELAELDATAFAAATRELVRAEILRSEPPLGFVHPLVQAAVYSDLAPGERELYHERAATLLVGLGAPKEQIAAHLLVMPARGQDWVVDLLRAAASEAVARGDLDSAIASLRRALDEPPTTAGLRLELLLGLGQAEAMTSLPAALGHLRGAYELADEPATRGQAADGLARALMFMHAPDEAAAIAGRAAADLPRELGDLARRLEAVEFLALVFGAEHGDRLERLRAYREIDASDGLGAGSLAVQAAWEWTKSAGPAESVCALARGALAGGELIRKDSLMAMAAAVVFALADLDEAVDVWDAMRAHAYRNGSAFTIGSVQLWGGYTQYLRGDLGEAESELRASLETVAFWGMPTQAQWQSPILAEILVERGALGEARALLDTVISPPPSSDHAILVDRALMRVLLAEGRPEEALAYADAYRAPCRVEASPTLCALAVAQGAGARAARPAGRGGRVGGRGTRDRARLGIPRNRRTLATRARNHPAHRRDRAARGGVRAARAGAGAARAGEGARRARGRTAASAQADRGPRAVAACAGAGGRLRRATACGWGPGRDLRHRRPPSHDRPPRSACLDGERATGRRSRRRRADEPRHRSNPVRDAEDDRGASQQRVPQAGNRIAPRTRRRARRDELTRVDLATITTITGRPPRRFAARRLLDPCEAAAQGRRRDIRPVRDPVASDRRSSPRL